MDTKTFVYIAAGLVGLFIIGLFVSILWPERQLDPVAGHNFGDFTSGGLAAGLIQDF